MAEKEAEVIDADANERKVKGAIWKKIYEAGESVGKRPTMTREEYLKSLEFKEPTWMRERKSFRFKGM